MKIKVLGKGCRTCKIQIDELMSVIQELNLELEVEKVENIEDIMSYGVMTTPAIVFQNKVITTGLTKKKKLISIIQSLNIN